MKEQTWNIVTPEDLFEIFKNNFEDFKQDPMAVRKALHCILTGWHLTDWVYEIYEKDKYKTCWEFRNRIIELCPELKIMHDLTTKFKHLTLSKPRANITGSEIHNGAFDRSHDFGHDISC